MSAHLHHYNTNLKWTGNTGAGTKTYNTYARSFDWHADGKPVIAGSSDPKFRGDPSKHNPEELLVAALSSCHMLWYLHLCADHGITVLGYQDQATGAMEEEKHIVQQNGYTRTLGGHFVRVILNPVIRLAKKEDVQEATGLHHLAHEHCFIANSVNFTVEVQPTFEFPE